MAGYLIRFLIAALAVVILFALMPPFLHLIGFSMNADLYQIFRIVVGALALLYVFFGPTPPWPAR